MGRDPFERPGIGRTGRRSAQARRARARARRRRRVAALVGLATTALAELLVGPALGPDTRGARVVRFTINSPLVHGTVPVSAVVPAGVSAGPRPLLVFF